MIKVLIYIVAIVLLGITESYACGSLYYPERNNLQFERVKIQNQYILLIYGSFAQGDAKRLDKVLYNYSKYKISIDEIWFDSGGGIAWEGIYLGEVIRKHRKMTRIPSGWLCASACTTAFLGGPIRVVEPGANFMVHVFSAYANKTGLFLTDFEFMRQSEQANAKLASAWADYANKMGVSTEFAKYTMGIAFNEIRTKGRLSQEQLDYFNVNNFKARSVGCINYSVK